MENKITIQGEPKITIHGVRIGDLTFSGLVFSWFLTTGRKKDQGLELELHAVQN